MSSLYLALESGYFEQAGLKVSIDTVLASAQALPLLAAGQLDASFTPLTPSFMNAVAKGARVKLVAGREFVSPTCGDFGCVYGTRERFPDGIPNFQALRGKRIAVQRAGGMGEMALEMELESAGLEVRDVRVAYMLPLEGLAALASGGVDGVVSQSDVEKMPRAAANLVKSPGLASILPGFQYSYVFFGRGLLDAEPARGANLLRAYFRATKEFLAGKTPRFMKEYAQSNGMDFEQVRTACRDTFAPDGRIDRNSIERHVRWAAARGYCTTAPSYEQLVDTRFLELANA